MNNENENQNEFDIIDNQFQLNPAHIEVLLDRLDEKDDHWKYNCYNQSVYKIGLGWTFKTEEIYGGCEGDGSEYWLVFKLTDPNGVATYWNIPGFYESYNGGELEFNNVFQVEPAEKVIRVWNQKQ
jgi:hypothetical protein